MSESETEEIQMYCCLHFSYAVKYGFITIDYDRNSVEIPIRSSLSDNENKQLIDKLQKKHISHIERDFLYPVHCPWCGIHLDHKSRSLNDWRGLDSGRPVAKTYYLF